jgi:hypothetical protein
MQRDIGIDHGRIGDLAGLRKHAQRTVMHDRIAAIGLVGQQAAFSGVRIVSPLAGGEEGQGAEAGNGKGF